MFGQAGHLELEAATAAEALALVPAGYVAKGTARVLHAGVNVHGDARSGPYG